VFGFKIFPMQLAELKRRNPILLSEIVPNRIVYLARVNREEQARSYARASASGVWCAEQERGNVFAGEISDAAVREAATLLEGQVRAWEAIFAALGVTPLVINYEDVCEKPVDAVDRIAKYLGVSVGVNSALSVPEVRKQRIWLGKGSG
jgi:LPS sulfotransferase NodH